MPKIREIQGLQVPRELVYAAMTKVDHDVLEETKRPRRDKPKEGREGGS